MQSPFPLPPTPPEIDAVAETLNPALIPLGFAPGQGGGSELAGQVIFCRGEWDGTDGGCIDLVVDLEATPVWRIIDVRYWGFPSETWHLDFDSQADLSDQSGTMRKGASDDIVR